MTMILDHEFVTTVPDELEPGTLYVSMPYATAIHLCACGCGEQAVTPISPTDWTLSFDGVSITLNPSIGNWRFPCRSHYWIRNNRVVWADDFGTVPQPDEEERESWLHRAWSRVKRWFRRRS